ncbi:MAG: ABC transporter permease subunit [Candidatus Poribacteria bacterium]|nr:ABC transporter permease subunit [Candidatus Poribacteria bacterium]
MNRSNKHQRVQRKIFIGIGYPLLIVAAFCTMVPLLWLLSSSFKTADEVFAVPIQWFPKLPSRVASSPYVVTNAYRKIKRPPTVDPDRWKTLKPKLESVIWTNVQEHIALNPQFSVSNLSEDLQTEMTKGIWQQHVATQPAEVWGGTTESIVKTVESSIIPETINTLWNSVYRQVTLGAIEIEHIEFNRMEVESTKWESDSDTLQQIQGSDVSEPITALSYDYQDKNNVRLTTTISSPMPIDRIRRIILPVRGDASYHRLSLTVSVNDTTYQPTSPFVLDTALQEDTTWRLHGIPSELESSHIPMRRIVANDETAKSDGALETDAENRLILQLTIQRPAYLSIVWNKLTSNYRNLWQTVPYNRYFINSVFIATASTLLTLFFCSLGGYAFAKYQFRGKTILFGILLASMMVPFQVLLVPLFGLMYDIGWLNSYKAIIIPFSVGAFGVFLMRQFIVTIPSELLDAARIDGCSEFGIYYRIVLPIIKPALGALTIYSFLSSWNGYLWPLIVLRDEAKYTLPIGLANLIGIYRQDYGMLMAGTLLSLLPIVILFLAMQREFVQGITLGSVKE